MDAGQISDTTQLFVVIATIVSGATGIIVGLRVVMNAIRSDLDEIKRNMKELTSELPKIDRRITIIEARCDTFWQPKKHE